LIEYLDELKGEKRIRFNLGKATEEQLEAFAQLIQSNNSIV